MLNNLDSLRMICVIIHLLGFASGASDFNTAQNDDIKNDDNEIVKRIDKFFNDIVACGDSQGISVSIVKGGNVFFSKGYGNTSMNVKDAKPVTSSTKFAIGSLTKAFTSLLFAKKVKESKNFDFDTPISKFMPGFRLVDDYRSEHASLRDLLGHRTAIPGYIIPLLLGIDPKMSRTQFARKLQYLNTPYSFREKFIYNNYNYVLAGHILEELSSSPSTKNGSSNNNDDVSWESLVNDTIFAPLGMTQSGFVDLVKDFSDDFALPRALLPNATVVDVDPIAFQMGKVLGPAGSISSSADDMAEWMKFLLAKDDKTRFDGLGLDHSMVQMTFEPSMTVNALGNTFKPNVNVSVQTSDYCMGWIQGSYGGYNYIFHLGNILTYHSALYLFPDIDLGIFLVNNGPSEKSYINQYAFLYIANLFLGYPTAFTGSQLCFPHTNITHKEDEEEGFKCTTATNCDILDYVGTYTNATFGDIKIQLNSNTTTTSAFVGAKQEQKQTPQHQLTFTYGLFGWLELTQISRTAFEGRIVGPLWYMNGMTGKENIHVVFSFLCADNKKAKNSKNSNNSQKSQKCQDRVIALSAVAVGGAQTGIFYKQYSPDRRLDNNNYNNNNDDNNNYNSAVKQHGGIWSTPCLSIAVFVVSISYFSFIRI